MENLGLLTPKFQQGDLIFFLCIETFVPVNSPHCGLGTNSSSQFLEPIEAVSGINSC